MTVNYGAVQIQFCLLRVQSDFSPSWIPCVLSSASSAEEAGKTFSNPLSELSKVGSLQSGDHWIPGQLLVTPGAKETKRESFGQNPAMVPQILL